MDWEKSQNRIQRLLLDSSLAFPIAFAAWVVENNTIFVSNKLKLLISADSNFLDTRDFVMYMKNAFGDFLFIASEKISNQSAIRREYSANFNIKPQENLSLKLVFDANKSLYIFTAEKAEKISEKRSETQAETSNKEIENTLDALPIYIWMKNSDSRLNYCNKKYSDALETSKEAVIAENLCLIPQKNKYSDSRFSDYKQKQTLENVVINGNRKYLEITESQAINYAIDVTDREELKKEYLTYKKQTEETLSQILVPIAIFNEKLELIFANNAILKLFNLASIKDNDFNKIIADLLDRGILLTSLTYEYFKEKAVGFFKEIIEPVHAFINLQNGKTVSVSIFPNQGGLLFLFEDITDTVALKREINSISANQQETLDRLKEGIVVFGSDNKVKLTNTAIFNIFDKKIEKTTRDSFGVHIKDFFFGFSEIFDSKDAMHIWALKLVNIAAQRVDFSDTLLTTKNSVINYVYFALPNGLNLLKFVDVTEKTNLEKALQEKTTIISQVDKIKDDLISNISYELYAPLNTILGFAEILINQYFGELNEKQIEYCNAIASSVNKITKVVSAIINLTSIEAGQIKLSYVGVNLFEFLNNIVDLFSARAKEQNVCITNAFLDKDFIAYFDDQSMSQAIFQLMSRIFQIISENGKIEINVDSSEFNPAYFTIIISATKCSVQQSELEKMKNATECNMEKNNIYDREFGMILASNVIRIHKGTLIIDSSAEQSIIKISLTLPNG
ncbi:hypothetical protein FACS1894113_4150 [Alphaproteobacteria bacterium]|nr:hypothetical protein FACS1894113_4150 [Alphaproteobacteria bacterium]